MLVSAVRTRVSALALALSMAAPSLPTAHAGAAHGLVVQPLPPTTMWTRYWNVRVRMQPSGTVLSSLDIDQEVRVTGFAVAGGARWLRVRSGMRWTAGSAPTCSLPR